MESSNIKIEDFMDVVYKCKFCPYSCTQSPDMGLHVKEKHLKLKQPGPSYPQANKNPGVSLPTGNFIYNVGRSNQLTIPEGTILANRNKNINIQVSEDLLPFPEAEGQAYMDKSLPKALPGAQSSSSLTLRSESNADVTELMGMVKTKNSSSMLESLSDPLSLERVVRLSAGPAPVSSFSATPSSLIHSSPLNQPLPSSATQSMAVMAIPIPPLNAENTSSQFIVQSEGDSQIPLALNDGTETKEYLLCGLCKLAFTSMEDCQSHMQMEHREMMQGVGVSIGVQVGGGKRGRKRKSESQIVQPVMKEEPELDPDDLEWLPSVPEGTQTTHRDGRVRRKVIPPKALKEDYVLGRRVVKKRQRSSISYLGYNVVCPMMNCKAKFKTKQSMEIHLSSHNLDDASFTCPECQASHDFWKHLRLHLWKVHKIDVDLLTCDLCDYKTDTVHKMNIHKEIHTDDKPYKCTICKKGFRQAAQQKNHMTIHKTPGLKHDTAQWFSSKRCEICERTFANSKCLTKHKEAVHAKLKPFQCSFCGHTTARKAMMELHVRTHTGEKPFKCNVCSYTTGDHNSLRRHKMRHTGEKQYQCGLCSYTCIQSISLKQHIKNKHPGVNNGIFQCSRCPFRSINQNHFDSHMLDHKKGLIPDVAVTLKVNETKPKKLSQKQSAASGKQKGATPSTGVESLFQKHPQFQTIMPGAESTAQAASMEAITVTPCLAEAPTEVFTMQVTMLAGGDTQVSAEDMARLSESPNLLALGISPLQLIYATLSTISEQADMSCVEEGRSSLLTIELVGGIQTSVLSSVQDNAITHSITYHFPVITTAATAVTSTTTTAVAPPFPPSTGDKANNPEGDGLGGAKADSVIHSDDIVQLGDKLEPSSLSTSSSSSSFSSAAVSLLASSSLSSPVVPPSASPMVVTSVLDGKGPVEAQPVVNNLVSSSFLTSALNTSYISLVGPAGMKNDTSQEIIDSHGEKHLQSHEEQSVYLVESNDLVGKSNIPQQQFLGQSDSDGNVIILDGKTLEFAGTDRDGSLLALPKTDKSNSNASGAIMNSLTTLINTDQNLTMINASASDILQLIPINFLDQNNPQELSTAQTFIPSSN